MVAYRIGIIPLIKCLKLTYPDVTEPCYNDAYGALGTLDNLERYFKSLKHDDPSRGYYTEPTKSILVVYPQNHKVGELFCQSHGIKVCTGARYLGCYIRDGVSKGYWLQKRTDKWERDIHALSITADKYPQ